MSMGKCYPTTVCGFGTYERGEFVGYVGKKCTREYRLWCNMLDRCYSGKTVKVNPTYEGCTVSENFLNFQYFAKWCQTQVGYKHESWQLDKDLLFRANKIYSESTCVFIPRHLNLLPLQSNAIRGAYPVGVVYNKQRKKYVAKLSMSGRSKYLGGFDDPQEAFLVYKAAKEQHVKLLADQYRGIIDKRVYEALYEWTVSEDD